MRTAHRLPSGYEFRRLLFIGTCTSGGDVTLEPEARRRHLYVVGQTGTGKSTLLLNLIVQDLAAGEGLALLGPHGDLARDVLNYIPNRRLNDLVYVNPYDYERPIGFNPLSAVARRRIIYICKMRSPRRLGPLRVVAIGSRHYLPCGACEDRLRCDRQTQRDNRNDEQLVIKESPEAIFHTNEKLRPLTLMLRE
jgi:DNA helicase HerA-like ATPase